MSVEAAGSVADGSLQFLGDGPISPHIQADLVSLLGDLSAPEVDTESGLYVGGIPGGFSGSQAVKGISEYTSGGSNYSGSVRKFFYDQVFFDSSNIDFGAVGSAESRTVEVWNSYMTPVTVNAIPVYSGDSTGVAVQVSSAAVGGPSGYDPLPLVLPSLAYMAITVQANEAGPPTISVAYRASITVNDLAESGTVGTEYHDLTVVGIRAQALIPRPNWENGIDETLEFLTTVVTSLSGMEHRTSLREEARRFLQYETLLSGQQAAKLRSLLAAWQNRIFMSPIWPYEIRLASAIAVTESQLTVTTVDMATCEIAVGGKIMLVDTASNLYEFLTVQSLTPDTPSAGYTAVVTTLPVKYTWGAGSRLYPAGMGYIVGPVPFSRYTQDVEKATISMMFDPETVTGFTPAVAAPATLTVSGSPSGSYEVLEQEPNWVDDVSASHQFEARIVDNQTGVYSTEVTREFPVKSWAFSWLFKDRSAIKTFREFLGRRKGSWKSFIAPSWATDFVAMESVVQGQSYLVCQPNGFDTTVYAMVDKNFHIEVEIGVTKVRRKITSIDSTVPGSMRLNLDGGFPAAADISTIRTVRLLETYRLGSDKVQLKWITPAVATCEAEVVTVTDSRRV